MFFRFTLLRRSVFWGKTLLSFFECYWFLKLWSENLLSIETYCKNVKSLFTLNTCTEIHQFHDLCSAARFMGGWPESGTSFLRSTRGGTLVLSFFMLFWWNCVLVVWCLWSVVWFFLICRQLLFVIENYCSLLKTLCSR